MTSPAQDIPDNEARFLSFTSEGLARIAAKRPAYFAPLWESLFGPSAAASDHEAAWRQYRSQLISQFEDQPVFGEEETGVNISQVYVPLRCWWGEEVRSGKEENPGRTSDLEPRRYDRVVVRDLSDAVTQWLFQYDPKDRIRFISGGPGSGKSTFAKRLSSVLAARLQWRVLFIPLQRLSGSGHLGDRINQFFGREISGPFSGASSALGNLGNDGHKDWVFVFDGLDELAKEGGGSESAAQDFASSLQEFASLMPTKIQARFIVLGRAPSMQEARRRLNLAHGRTLYVADLLPFSGHRYTYTIENCDIDGNEEVINADQRGDLWARWAVATQKDIAPPPAMSAKELEDITKEPLLAHLLIVSGYVEENWELAAENRNRIYRAIFQKIWTRESTKDTRSDLNDLGEIIFTYLLQALGVAAWRGGGRTGDEAAFMQVRETLLPPSALKLVKGEKKTDLANVALLFYTRKDEEGGQGYEFVHKSFGEYLTACALLDAFLRWGVQVENVDSDFDEEEFLTRWLTLAGAAPITEEVYKFLFNEVLLKINNSCNHIDNARRYIRILSPLIGRIHRHGFPFKSTSLSFRQMEEEQRNAELALWSIMGCLAPVAYPIDLFLCNGRHGWQPGPIDIPELYDNIFSLSILFNRHADKTSEGGLAFYQNDEEDNLISTIWVGNPLISLFMSHLNLPGIVLSGRQFPGVNFQASNLSNTSFHGTPMIGWNLSYADLSEAYLSHNELQLVTFEEACLDGARLDHVKGADVYFMPRSKKGLKTNKTSFEKRQAPLLFLGAHSNLPAMSRPPERRPASPPVQRKGRRS